MSVFFKHSLHTLCRVQKYVLGVYWNFIYDTQLNCLNGQSDQFQANNKTKDLNKTHYIEVKS